MELNQERQQENRRTERGQKVDKTRLKKDSKKTGWKEDRKRIELSQERQQEIRRTER